jgi:DNA-binding beta-propeller fold protein YncE
VIGRVSALALAVSGALALLPVACSEPPDAFARPTAVAFLPDGRIVVADGYDHARIALFTPNGAFDRQFGERGVGPGQLETPHGVIVDEAGRILVADRENARIQVFDEAGTVLDVWDDPRLGRPWGLALGDDDHVFVVDGGDQDPERPRTRVLEVDAEGRVVRELDAQRGGAPRIEAGHAIAAGRDGSVYVADLDGRVVKLVRR